MMKGGQGERQPGQRRDGAQDLKQRIQGPAWPERFDRSGSRRRRRPRRPAKSPWRPASGWPRYARTGPCRCRHGRRRDGRSIPRSRRSPWRAPAARRRPACRRIARCQAPWSGPAGAVRNGGRLGEAAAERPRRGPRAWGRGGASMAGLSRLSSLAFITVSCGRRFPSSWRPGHRRRETAVARASPPVRSVPRAGTPVPLFLFFPNILIRA